MSAHGVDSAVIREQDDDARFPRFLVVIPRDRIVWVTSGAPAQAPDLTPEGRKRSVMNAGVRSMSGKLVRLQEQEESSAWGIGEAVD